MKSFKTVISELDAKDYKAEKDSDDEVKKYKPRSKGEEKFKDAHKKEVKDYPEGIGPQNESVELDERAPPIVTDSIKDATMLIKRALTALSSAGGKHASRGTKMKLKKQSALLKQVEAELKRIHAEALNEEVEEELEIFSEGAFDSIQKIAKGGKSARVKFDNGKSVDVDSESASAVVKMVNGLRSGKDKVVSDLEKSPENFMKVLDKAFG